MYRDAHPGRVTARTALGQDHLVARQAQEMRLLDCLRAPTLWRRLVMLAFIQSSCEPGSKPRVSCPSHNLQVQAFHKKLVGTLLSEHCLLTELLNA